MSEILNRPRFLIQAPPPSTVPGGSAGLSHPASKLPAPPPLELRSEESHELEILTSKKLPEALTSMRTASQQKVTFPHRDSAVPGTAIRDGVLRLPEVAEAPVASVKPQLPAMIPDERLDYYAWVFRQRGFSSRQITFEQFLAVVAAVQLSGLCPDCDPDYVRAGHLV
jgi:hypothetical protein